MPGFLDLDAFPETHYKCIKGVTDQKQLGNVAAITGKAKGRKRVRKELPETGTLQS